MDSKTLITLDYLQVDNVVSLDCSTMLFATASMPTCVNCRSERRILADFNSLCWSVDRYYRMPFTVTERLGDFRSLIVEIKAVSSRGILLFLLLVISTHYSLFTMMVKTG